MSRTSPGQSVVDCPPSDTSKELFSYAFFSAQTPSAVLALMTIQPKPQDRKHPPGLKHQTHTCTNVRTHYSHYYLCMYTLFLSFSLKTRDGYRLVFIRYITDTFKTIPVPKRCRNRYFYKKNKKNDD